MDDLGLLIELHAQGQRQGPGSDEHTRLALALSGLQARAGLQIADIGCGSGASTLVLAKALDAHITAVDLAPQFLRKLEDNAQRAGLSSRVSSVRASMDTLPFGPGCLDAIWSEGAIYNMGFAAGIEAWRAYLKPNGILAVSELTWLTATRPAELHNYWSKAYPEVDTAAAKMAVLERLGFTPTGYFVLPEQCWLENYYRPLQLHFDKLLSRHQHADAAAALVAEEKAEIALYEQYRDYFSYGFYIARYASS